MMMTKKIIRMPDYCFEGNKDQQVLVEEKGTKQPYFTKRKSIHMETHFKEILKQKN